MNWVDTATYPPERVDLLLGSDLVYDASILTVLVPAICSTLSAGKCIFYYIIFLLALLMCLPEILAGASVEFEWNSPFPFAAHAYYSFFPFHLTDGSFLYCAPNTGRHGMDGLEIALSRVGIVAVEKFAAPEE